MKKIENFSAVAPKLKGGSLEYCLWTEDDGALYVQILRNLTETNVPGTHSKLLFRASDCLNEHNATSALKEIRGKNPETLSEECPGDNDHAGFIKAILRQLFP